MPKPKTSEEINALANALKEAKTEAMKYAEIEDGGTCNLDSSMVLLNDWSELDIAQASMISLVQIGEKYTSRWWKNWRCIRFGASGQGNRRSKMVQVFSAKLKELGFNSAVYYQID